MIGYADVVSTIALDIPDDALAALHVDAATAGAHLRLAAAVKLYELRRLSSGAAAKLAGVPRVEFLMRLGEFGADTFTLSEDELAAEMKRG